MRALLALFATAFLLAGCGREDATETTTQPGDTTMQDSATTPGATDPAPMPPPSEDATGTSPDTTAPGSETTPSTTPPSEPSPTP